MIDQHLSSVFYVRPLMDYITKISLMVIHKKGSYLYSSLKFFISVLIRTQNHFSLVANKLHILLGPYVICFRLLLGYDSYAKKLVRFKLVYSNVYDITARNVLDCIHDAPRMLVSTGRLKKCTDVFSSQI